MILALLLFLFTTPQEGCLDRERCRALAIAAQEQKDYEAFHDLAWAAYRKGRGNDSESMLLVARAQSLSGRPGDALVMLERIAALGGATDAFTSEDFARVRALPRWPEVATKLRGEAPAVAGPEPSDPAPARRSGRASPSPAPPKPADAPAPAMKPAEPPPSPAAKPVEAPPELPTKAAAPPPAAETKPVPAAPPAPNPKRDAGAPLTFTTVLNPSALVYDAVSKRFIIADRQARRIAIVDEHTGQVATLVGALGALGDIGGIAVDSQQGDLWVVTTSGDEASLHRMQLVSGRVRSTVSLPGMRDAVVAMTYARGTGIIVADAKGTVWRLHATGRSEKLAALEYVPRGFAADASGRLYVTAGGPRLARFTVGAGLRKVDVIDLEPGLPAETPFAIARGRLVFVVPMEGRFEIRSVPLR